MALALFLFKVSNLNIPKSKSEIIVDNEDQLTSNIPAAQLLVDENTTLLCAKVSFRGISLWSNNVPIRNGTASFIARGQKPKKFNFQLATVLRPDDKIRIEFHTTTLKRKRQKMIATYEIILESLISSRYIDLPEENLSDPANCLMASTVQMKIYYTPPDLEKQKLELDATAQAEMIDWNMIFDDEGRHGGHRFRHVISKKDNKLKKLGAKLTGKRDDADTDSYSDTDFNEVDDLEKSLDVDADKNQKKMERINLELLEKSLGRYEGNAYELTEWQIMIHIIQGREFPGLELNPYIIVQIGNQKRRTNVHKSSNSPYFGEFFTFDFTLPAIQIMEKVIYFKVHNEQKFISTFTDTKPIGVFRLDVSTVYNEKDHAFERKWAQLINPDNIGSPCGYLLLSISVTERGAPSKNVIGESVDDDDEFKETKTLIPAAMPPRLFPVQLKITFYSATELPEMMTEFLASFKKKIVQSEAWEPVDPYVEVTYNTMQAKTSHRNGTTPVWGEGFYLVGRFPPLIRTMKISLKDHASVQQDRIISSFFIDLFLICGSNPKVGFLPTLGPTWMFLYGSPREYTMNKDQDGLSEGMGEGVCYKGRLLMAIECHPVSGDHTSNMNVQKETGIHFPEANIFPMKRTFLLFGCIYDVSMIDKSFGNATIRFELSIGPSGYLNPQQLAAAGHQSVSSLTPPCPRIPVNNSEYHYRLPIDLNKPIIFTKYIFHDYIYRMTLSNRLKQAAEHLYKQTREFESKLNSKVSNEILTAEYKKIEQYVHTLPCGCGGLMSDNETSTVAHVVHPNLYEILDSHPGNLKMNELDIKRRQKILHNIESLKGWLSKDVDFDETKRYEIVKGLHKIIRSFRQMAIDAQPSLPDVFLWMICDSKRVAYARIPPEDLFFNICENEKGLQSGRVQTLFLKTPRTTDKPLKASTNAKVQIYLWLGIEEYELFIYKHLPAGFDMPVLPLHPDTKNIRYNQRTFYELRCHCFKARSLIASDETGLSDPYLSITVGNETQTTPILKESLCPQWNMTLVFRNLMHIGTRETAEEIVGTVVVECYDYDPAASVNEDGPDLIGRFCTTAKLDIFNEDNQKNESLFHWYEFKLGEKGAGELLAVFELIEIDPQTRQPKSTINLEEVLITAENFPPANYITNLMKNNIYGIPYSLMPDMRTYEIEIMFWGLRECRSIGIQSIQHAEVTIECAGSRVTRSINDVQKYPNFRSTNEETDKYKLIVDLPNDSNFWPHLSILCVQNRYFGMKEVVGNLVVTDLQKYLPVDHFLSTLNNQSVDEETKEYKKILSYDFNRVRRSVIDAYEAAITEKDKDLGKKKLVQFESEAGHEGQISIISDDGLGNDENADTPNKHRNDAKVDNAASENEPLSKLEIEKRTEMEKTAGWWNKYYASKAKLRLLQQSSSSNDDTLLDNNDGFAELFKDDKKIVDKRHVVIWSKTKKAVRSLIAKGREQYEELNELKSTSADSFDFIETDRLKELSLLQTFDIIETELEKVPVYEGFNDCIDTFPLYKGKGSSRSDEIGDENRIYAKFKGKLRIQEISMPDTYNNRPVSVYPILLNPVINPLTQTNQQMRLFDYNKNPITLKCRLYIIKALLYRGSDQSGKADPYIKIVLNNDTIIDDIKNKLQNTLEPVFGTGYEFEVKLPVQSLLRIQIWDWDMTSSNDMIAETKLDIENRWFSCHRATCGLPKRYDSAGYNAWRDTKKPTTILSELCHRANITPIYATDGRSLTIGDQRFECDSECIEFIDKRKTSVHEKTYRKVDHEAPEKYLKENTALAALHGWGKRINPHGTLVAEHIENRPLFNSEFPQIEQGKLEMWLDFFPMSKPPSSAMIDITPPKPVAYQLRLTIWNTADVELNDENFLTGEKTSDIYVKAYILGEKIDAQQTDIHYRSLTGEGNFNWRFIFDFNYLEIEEKVVYEAKDSVFQVGNTLKKIPPRLVIRVYDADFFTSDDFLGECILDLTHIPMGPRTAKKCKADVLLNPKNKSINLFTNKRIAGWWPMLSPKKEGEIRDKDLIGGKVEAEISLVTAEDAEKNPVGKAREAPQPLDEPNRPKSSFLWFTSPWKTFRYAVWGSFKWYIILGVILFIFIIFLLLCLWSLPGAVVTQIMNKIFGVTGSG